MNDRIERLRGELGSLGAATFLATNSVNVRYLTGFDSSNAAVLVDGDRVLVATDGRYTEAARALDGVDLVEADRDIFGFLGKRLGELVSSPIAFESDFVTVAAHGALSANGSTLVPAKGVVLGLRAVKDDA
jgi:Xaa-Pro aminopeptidase